MILKSINPYTNEVIQEFEEFTDGEMDRVLVQSGNAFEKWKRTTFEFRGSLMEKVAALLEQKIKEYAETITAEMGKPIKESRAEIEKCAWACQYYARNTERLLSTEYIDTDADTSYVSFEPLGTVLGIMPWNFPFWQVFRFAVPTLMAGNTILLKHASNVQICAQKIENIFTGSGFPPNVFRNLILGSGKMGKIIKHDCVRAVSLTGSESAGKKVAEAAGNALKKCLLELGGSNAFIVLRDANLRKAAAIGIKARFQNAGQSCIAAKRFITDRNISDEFLSMFLEGMRNLKSGDPMKEETDLGPLANIQMAEKVEKQLKRSVAMGARLIAGGVREMAFYLPSVVVDVRPGMPLYDEEVFGPVAPVTIADNTEEAIALANRTNFGLGVSLFTNDSGKAADLVKEFHDGAVFINGMVKSDPRLPFGGTRRSGFGRELAGYGIREFVNIKTVWSKNL